jgi:hypothetical protein
MDKKISDFEESVGMTYEEAKKYLIQEDKWDKVKGQDGYTIVTYARWLKEGE